MAAIGESEEGAADNRRMLTELVRALDRATHTRTRIVYRPFARSLQETAAGQAAFQLPLIQFDHVAAPAGLAYVDNVDFGNVQFDIYSRKDAPISAETLAQARVVEVEGGHHTLLSRTVKPSNCIACSLDKIVIGRVDALVAATDIVDPLLRDPRYQLIHRARYKSFVVRALVPAQGDTAATRNYLSTGIAALKKSGELAKITRPDQPYVGWQP